MLLEPFMACNRLDEDFNALSLLQWSCCRWGGDVCSPIGDDFIWFGTTPRISKGLSRGTCNICLRSMGTSCWVPWNAPGASSLAARVEVASLLGPDLHSSERPKAQSRALAEF